MLKERVTAIMDDRLTPLPGPPLLSSAGSGWPGFLFERHVVHTSREEVGWSWHETHIGVCVGGPSVIEIDGAAGKGRFPVHPGCITLFPKGCDRTTIRHSGGGADFLVAQIDEGRLERLFEDEAPHVGSRLTPQLYVQDPTVLALLSNMRAEVEAACPSGTLYAESLSLALVAYLSTRYSLASRKPERSRPKLSPIQVRTVLDYLDAHLGGDFSVTDLGRLTRLNPRRFSLLFRNTFETPLHRYLLNARIRRAKSLLLERRLPIVEISDTLGFASQSHFTDVFRRTAGVSPKRYQRTR